MNNLAILKSFSNIKTYPDNIYDIKIVLYGPNIGSQVITRRGLRLGAIKKAVFNMLREYPDETCDKYLYQDCYFKSDLLLLIQESYNQYYNRNNEVK